MRRLLPLAALACFFLAAWILLGNQPAQEALPPSNPTPAPTPLPEAIAASLEGWTLIGEAPYVYNPVLQAYELPPSHQGGDIALVGIEPFVFGSADSDQFSQTGSPPAYNGERGPDTELVLRPVFADAPSDGCTWVTARFSWYSPNLVYEGGFNPNCSNYSFEQAWCLNRTSSGKPWEGLLGQGAAMPLSVPFGTKVYAFGREWTVWDRGGAIIEEDEIYWIDFLTLPEDWAENLRMDYGQTFEVCLVYP